MRRAIDTGLGWTRELELPSMMAQLGGTAKAYDSECGCSIIVALEPAKAAPGGIWLPPDELMLWHISIAHSLRYPTWDEIADARYQFCPDEITMAMLLPPPDRYVNEHPHCFHLWQIDDRRADETIAPY
jgi:hypothetical protein